MKKKLVAVLACVMALCMVFTACGGGSSEGSKEPDNSDRKVTVTDMGGDEVTIEGEVNSIVNLWPSGTSSLVVMGAGELVTGIAINNPSTMNAWMKLVYPECVDIPAFGGTTPAIEELVNQKPDLVIIHPSSAKDGFAQQIRDVGIPAININFNNYETMIEAYTILGEVLGGEYQEKLATWCKDVEDTLANHKQLVASIAEEDKPVVYYISGEELISTMAGSSGETSSMQGSWIINNGGVYASDVMGLTTSEANAEEVFKLNPDIIMVGGTNQKDQIEKLKTTDGWKDLNAVKNGRVYNIPYGCFGWDRFGLESVMQLDYALMCIQPEIAEKNGIDREYMVNRVIDFYKYYNGTELTAEQAGYMLDGLQPDGTEYPASTGGGGQGGGKKG